MILIAISDKIVPSSDFVLSLVAAYSRITGKDVSGAAYAHLANGAPIVTGTKEEIFVSVSHSENRVAVALSDAPVGVDIEYMRTREYNRISERFGFFADNLSNFYTRWTMGEASMKADGRPLSGAMKNPNENARVLPFFDNYALSVCGVGDIYIYPYQILP